MTIIHHETAAAGASGFLGAGKKISKTALVPAGIVAVPNGDLSVAEKNGPPVRTYSPIWWTSFSRSASEY
jgi:hypothetical protein